MRRLGAHAAATALVFGLLGALGGCSVFSDTPASASKAVDDAVAEIRDIPGVAAVSSMITQLRRPAAESQSEITTWHANIIIEAEPDPADLGRLAAEVEAQISAADETVSTSGTVHVPAGRDGPAGVLAFDHGVHPNEPVPPAELAATLERLRSIPGVESAAVSQGDPIATLDVTEPSRWPAVAAQLRALPDFGLGAITAVLIDTAPVAPSTRSAPHSRLKIDPTSPNPALIPILAELAGDDDVVRVSFEGTRDVAVSSTAPLLRPSLIVEVQGKAALERVTVLLTGLDDAVTSVSGIGRPSFDVFSDVPGPTGEREGFIGLPLGSPEPDDLKDVPTAEEPAGGSPVVVLEPGAADGRVADDRILLTNRLDAAGDVAGIRGTPEASVAACEPGPGEHAVGEVVIPIFEIADRADDAYAAITAAWVADGYRRTDRAMGTEMYSAADPRSPGATMLTIRGTTEGISIRASSVCVTTG